MATMKAKEHNDSLDLVENTMDHLLLLIAYFLSLCSFSWLAGNVVKWKYKNSPGLDLCSWLYHYISTVWLRSFSSEVWLAGKPQARRNQLRPDAHNNGYKMPMILLHCEEYKAVDTEDHKFSSIRDLQAPRLTSLILGQLWRARKPFSQKHRCGWWMDLNSNALICNGNVKWFEIMLAS